MSYNNCTNGIFKKACLLNTVHDIHDFSYRDERTN